ncbi:hypothetical protein GCM10010191_10290 [Actinomadura vinacea]|uniref:Uncharacterized protein n=1 Tax=Actinomadura vinacea TaxID=115336 RepID=A0ABN3IHI3_9ACTN
MLEISEPDHVVQARDEASDYGAGKGAESERGQRTLVHIDSLFCRGARARDTGTGLFVERSWLTTGVGRYRAEHRSPGKAIGM